MASTEVKSHAALVSLVRPERCITLILVYMILQVTGLHVLYRDMANAETAHVYA